MADDKEESLTPTIRDVDLLGDGEDSESSEDDFDTTTPFPPMENFVVEEKPKGEDGSEMSEETNEDIDHETWHSESEEKVNPLITSTEYQTMTETQIPPSESSEREMSRAQLYKPQRTFMGECRKHIMKNYMLYVTISVLCAMATARLSDAYQDGKWRSVNELLQYVTKGIERTPSCGEIAPMAECMDRCDCYMCIEYNEPPLASSWRCQDSSIPCAENEKIAGEGCSKIAI